MKPVTGGGIPASHAYVELKLVFKDGGAFDFHSTYERVREQVVHAVDVARESGRDVRDVIGDVVGEELPAYEGPGVGSGFGSMGVNYVNGSGGVLNGQQRHVSDQDVLWRPEAPPECPTETMNGQRETMEPPNEDPPGYEDVQRGGVADSLEEGLRRQAS